MKAVRRRIAALLALSLIFNPLIMARADEDSPTFTPPWTQERVKPPEVTNKDNEKPVTWCGPVQKQKKKQGVVVETYNETKAVYADGTEIVYQDGPNRKKWIVTIPGPNGPTKTTYDLTDPSKPTKTTEAPGKPKTEQVWQEAKAAYDAEQKKKGTWLFPSDASRLANVAFPNHSPAEMIAKENTTPFNYSPVQLAATAERPRSENQPTQERTVINIKIVTYGNPPSDTVVHFDPGPETTPEDFLEIPPTTVSWDPERDGDGPKTVPLTGDGFSVVEIPGGWIFINVGWGWAHASVPQSMVQECGDGGEDPDLEEAKRLTDLAKKANEGGPSYWRNRAKQYEAGAQRAEQELRGGAKEAALRRAREARAAADELERRGIPDKPDPKLPKNQQQNIDKQRADGIKKITDEAAELTRRASTG